MAFKNIKRELWLPWPPSVNMLFKTIVIKGVVRRAPAKAYKVWSRDVHATLLLENIPPFTVPVVLQLELVPPDRRARDCSNYFKAVEDELVKARILLGDDARYVKAVASWWAEPNKVRPGVSVTIKPAAMVTQKGQAEAA